MLKAEMLKCFLLSAFCFVFCSGCLTNPAHNATPFVDINPMHASPSAASVAAPQLSAPLVGVPPQTFTVTLTANYVPPTNWWRVLEQGTTDLKQPWSTIGAMTNGVFVFQTTNQQMFFRTEIVSK